MLSDTLPSILHHNTFVVSSHPPNAGSQHYSLRANFVPMHAPLSARRVYPRDLCQESTTLRQTKLNEAGRAHSGIVRLKLQLG